MSDSRSFFSVKLLSLLIGLFFILLGLTGVFKELGTSIFSMTSHYYWLEVAFGIIEIISGILIVFGFIFSMSRAIMWGGLIALCIWIARIVLTKFIWGLSFINNGNISIYKLIDWSIILLCELIIAFSILVIIKRFD